MKISPSLPGEGSVGRLGLNLQGSGLLTEPRVRPTCLQGCRLHWTRVSLPHRGVSLPHRAVTPSISSFALLSFLTVSKHATPSDSSMPYLGVFPGILSSLLWLTNFCSLIDAGSHVASSRAQPLNWGFGCHPYFLGATGSQQGIN